MKIKYMNTKKIKNNNLKAGFTLVEALVAVSILMIAIASPMTLAQKGLSTATLSKDQMIAAFLAQDAVEAVKNIRDQIAIRGVGGTGGDWLDGTLLNDCMCSNDNDCNFDAPSVEDTLKFCTIDTTAPKWENSQTSIFQGLISTTKLKISYSTDQTDSTRKNFLKYDYIGANCDDTNNTYVCNSKFSRYINIRKDPTETNPNEAVVNVRVFWDSPLGIQKIDVKDYIYNYSENLGL
jgi:type II secretory pathway pseudopilin PulG